MSKIELPPLPRPDFAAPTVYEYTAAQLRARDRKIVELCASIAREFRRGAGDPVCADVADAIRSLLESAEKETK